MNGSVYVGQKALSLTEYEKTAPISGVTIWVDDENCYEAGDETGTVIEQDCPYATQEMANNLLATLQGYSYQGLEASGAKVSPVAELGDGLTIGGLYTQLAYQNIRFSTGEVMDVSAPGSNETLHEYKTEGETTKQFNHQIAETRSTISKTSKEILLQVENELEGLSSSFSVQLDNITGRINGLDGEFAEVSLTLDGLTIKDSTGATKINGSAVYTPNLYVSAANISGTLSANQVNLTGAITFSDLSSSVQNDINDSYSMAEDAQSAVNRWTYGGSTYIDGTQIMTGTVTASTLEGGEIYLLDGSGRRAGSFTLEGASSYNGRAISILSGAIALNAQYGDVYLESGEGATMQMSSYTRFGCDVTPSQAGRYTCGSSDRTWTDIYAENGEIVVSDENRKNSIEPLPEKYIDMMDLVTPVRYKLNNGSSGRYHPGFTAQDVERAMAAAGVSDQEYGGWIKDVDEDGNPVYMLRYTEMIAILWAKIKQLEGKING